VTGHPPGGFAHAVNRRRRGATRRRGWTSRGIEMLSRDRVFCARRKPTAGSSQARAPAREPRCCGSSRDSPKRNPVPRSRSSPAPWLASSESAPARAGVIGQRRGGVPTCRRGNLSCQDSLEVCLVQEMAVRQVPLGLLGQALREPKGLCSHPASHLDAWLGFAAERGGPGVTRLLVLLAVAAWGFMHASGGPRDDHRRCPRIHRPRPGRACRGAEPRGALRAHLAAGLSLPRGTGSRCSRRVSASAPVPWRAPPATPRLTASLWAWWSANPSASCWRRCCSCGSPRPAWTPP